MRAEAVPPVGRLRRLLRGADDMERAMARYYGGRLLLALASFLTVPLLSRALGMEGYGRVSFWLGGAQWAALVCGGWFSQSVLRYHATFVGSPLAEDYARTRQVGEAALGLLAFAAALALSFFWAGLSWAERLLIALNALLVVMNVARSARAQAERDPARVVRGDAARTALPLLLLVAALLCGLTLDRAGALLAFALGLAAANLLLGRGAGADGPPPADAPPPGTAARRMFRFGLPMGVWMALAVAQSLCGRWALQRAGGWHDVGVFTAYQDVLTKVGTLLFMPVTHALHGQVMALWAEGRRAAARSALKRAAVYAGLLSLALVGGATLFRPLLDRVLFGADAPAGRGGAALVAALTLAVALGNAGLIAHKGLELAERGLVMALLLLASIGVTLLLSVLLAGRAGALGVAWATALGAGVYALSAAAASRAFLRREAGDRP